MIWTMSMTSESIVIITISLIFIIIIATKKDEMMEFLSRINQVKASKPKAKHYRENNFLKKDSKDDMNKDEDGDNDDSKIVINIASIKESRTNKQLDLGDCFIIAVTQTTCHYY